jgi:hypothetical protein
LENFQSVRDYFAAELSMAVTEIDPTAKLRIVVPHAEDIIITEVYIEHLNTFRF